MKRISIITVCYNDKIGLEKTIKSVISQTSNDYEFIVIDGNSDDGSKEVIANYQSEISIAISEPDLGIYNAMNKGISLAKGEYLLFLNAGDRLHQNDTLAQCLTSMSNDDSHIFYGDIVYEEPGKADRIATFPSQINFNYLYNYSLSHQASFIKKSLFGVVGKYNEDYKIVSDWEFFILAIFKYQATYKHLGLIICNYDGAGISSNQANYPQMYAERNTTLKKYFADFIKDNSLLNQFQDKKFKQLLYVKENQKWLWKVIKFILKISSFFSKKTST